MKITAIVLAAGKSSRMGTNKLLLQLDDKTIIEHILDQLTNYETLVITGHHPDKIKSFIQRYNCKEVHNPDYEKGMTTSLKTGLRAIDEDVDAVLMVLSDTFGFKPSLLDSMEKKMTHHQLSL